MGSNPPARSSLRNSSACTRPCDRIREREEPRPAELLPPGGRAIRTGHEQTSVRLQYASDLAEDRDPRIQVLDDIEEQRGVERRVGKRERAREVPGEELHVVEAWRQQVVAAILSCATVVIDPNDALRPAGRAERMATVGAPHIEHDPPRGSSSRRTSRATAIQPGVSGVRSAGSCPCTSRDGRPPTCPAG